MTTILIIAIAVRIYLQTDTLYSALIIASLLLSLIGDIFLVNKKYFLHGLVAFLFAHICFMLAFCSVNGFSLNIVPLVALLAIGIGFYVFRYKHLKKFAIPVAMYITVIIVMSWQAVNLAVTMQTPVYYAIALASMFFMFSDSIIAYNEFKKPHKIAEVLIHSTYWIAIYTFTIAGHYLK